MSEEIKLYLEMEDRLLLISCIKNKSNKVHIVKTKISIPFPRKVVVYLLVPLCSVGCNTLKRKIQHWLDPSTDQEGFRSTISPFLQDHARFYYHKMSYQCL